MEDNNNSSQSSGQSSSQTSSPSSPSSRPATPQRDTSSYQERSSNDGGTTRKG
jgi:hypothetical protein